MVIGYKEILWGSGEIKETKHFLQAFALDQVIQTIYSWIRKQWYSGIFIIKFKVGQEASI